MRFRDLLALNISPLLLRLVLGLTFVYAGLPKFKAMTFEGAEAQMMVDLGWKQATAVPPVDLADSDDGGDAGVTGAGDVDNDADTDTDVDVDTGANDDQGEGAVVVEGESELGEDDAADVAVPVVITTGPIEAKGLHGLALMLHKNQLPYPVLMAWLAAITELVGGAFILVGFLSRIWGLGLSVTMFFALYFTTFPELQEAMTTTGIGRYCRAIGALDTTVAHLGFWQLALFSMSLAILFSGAGVFSVDRLLFKKRRGGAGVSTIEVTTQESSSSLPAARGGGGGGGV